MLRSRLVDLAFLGAALAVVGIAVLVDGTAGGAELVFGTVLLVAALTVGRLVWRASRRAAAERGTARRLANTPAEEVARRAVVEERARLAADIQAVVLGSTARMLACADAADRAWDRDPASDLQRIQVEGGNATAELRRMLGLLREAETAVPPVASAQPAADHAASRVRPADVWIAVAFTTLAVAEHFLVGPGSIAGAASVTSAVFTAAAAATVGLWRAAPAAGAGLCGLVFLTGAALTQPVTGGFWMLLGVGALAWASTASGRWLGVAGAALLACAVAAAADARGEPESLPLDVSIVVVGAAGGALVRYTESRRVAARRQSSRRAAELADAAGHAVHAERLTVARDLHDVLSHAVGVIVVQAGAAAALRPRDQRRARTALDVVRQTATETLAELDRFIDLIGAGALGRPAPTGGSVHRDSADLLALIKRMRAAGLTIDVTMHGTPNGETGSAVYRIVQEALTNVLRHAPGADVQVVVRANEAGTSVEVINAGPPPSTDCRRGYGLIGIAERVHRFGGHLTSGPGPDGTGFQVAARIPAQTRTAP